MVRTVLGFGSTAYGLAYGLVGASGLLGALVGGRVARSLSMRRFPMAIAAFSLTILPQALAMTIPAGGVMRLAVLTASTCGTMIAITLANLIAVPAIQMGCPENPKQSDFDSETAFIPHLSITQPDWNMNSTMSAYDIRLKPVCRGRRIRMSAHTSTWARCRCRRCAKSIAAFHASSQCATRKVLFIGELDRFGLSQQSFVEDDRSVFD